MKNFNILSKARWLLIAALATIVSTNVWGYTYTQLTSIANIDQYAVYVLGVEGSGSGKGFHYSGTSSWGLTAGPTTQTPLYYTLVPNNNNTNFKASTTISNTTYYLQVPTSNTFSMNTSSTAANTTLIIGTTQVSGTNYAVANSGTTNRHLRINATSGLRSYAGTTGNMAFFYVVRCANPTSLTNGTIAASTAHLSWTDNTNTNCSYEIYCSTSSSSPASNATPTTTVSTKYVDLTGLMSSTSYNWWVRAKDNTNSAIKSEWVKGSNFTTTSAAYSIGWSITSGGGSLSTTSGTSTTVTPTSGWRYASPAYTILTGAATVTQSTNTFTATPTANSTIRINMEEIPTHDIHFNTGGLVAIADATDIQEGATYSITETPAASLSEECEYPTFVGWTTESSTYVHGTSPLYTTSITMSTSDITLYAVYSKTSGGSTPTAYTAGDLGEFVIAAYNTSDSKWYALPQNPTVSSGKVTGVEITVSESNSVYYVTPTNATGYTWTIQTNTNGSCSQSLYDADNSKSIYHSNGGTSGTNLSYGTSTGYGWNIASETNGLTFQGVGISSNTCTTNSRGMLMQGTTFGGYALSNEDQTGYYRIQVLPIVTPGTTTYSLEPNCNAPKITVSTEEIDFGDKKVGGSYTATFTVSGENLEGNITLAVTGNARYSVNQTTLTPTNGTVSTTEITVTFAPTASGNNGAQVDITSTNAATKTVTLKGYSKWEVTWMKDGEEYETTLVASGTKPTLPAEPTSCDTEESNTFYGWTNAEWAGKIDDVSAKTIHKSNGTMPNVSNNNTIYYAVFAKKTGSANDYTDQLTRATTTVPDQTGTTVTYTDWSEISASNSGHSDAVYAGNSAGDKNSIQLRASTNSGIITTTSGGKAKKVTVDWNSNSASGRTIDIYGKNTAYAATSELYGDGKGTKIGSIVYGTSTELIITDDYEYIGIRSNSNALYLNSISVDWQEGDYTYSKYMTNCCDYHITIATPAKTGTGTGTVAFASGGSAVAAGSDVPTCAGMTTITATVTPNPGHQCDAVSFSGGSVSVSPTIPSPFVPFDNAGATTYTLTFAQNTNATLSTAVTFTVLQDKYYDYMHDNATETHNGNYGTAPTLSSSTPGAGCAGEHYKFIGWIPESDMNMETGVPTTTAHMVTGGQTGMYATGTNYYAIWAEEL